MNYFTGIDGICPSVPSPRSGPPPLTYAEWRKRAREKLAGPTTMREKTWTHLFITGKSPDEAAAQANIFYSNSQVRALPAWTVTAAAFYLQVIGAGIAALI